MFFFQKVSPFSTSIDGSLFMGGGPKLLFIRDGSLFLGKGEAEILFSRPPKISAPLPLGNLYL